MDPLRREVMAPRHPVGWLGPLFVLGSTLALTMGMAAMALAPHPRHHRHGCPNHRAAAPQQAMQADADRMRRDRDEMDAALTTARCGMAVYRAHPDGMMDATYEVCAHPTKLAR